MSAPLLLDLSHTCHTRARTGIQRVTRSLWRALQDEAVAITHDPHLHGWRRTEDWENANLAATEAAAKRGSRWSLRARWQGRARRFLRRTPSLPQHSGLLVPEVFSAQVASALPGLLAKVRGPRVALFHDAIALKFPELTPPRTVSRFPAYLIELLAFDGIAAVSDDSRQSLLDYWRWLGVSDCPPVRTLPLGLDPPAPRSVPPKAQEGFPLTLLSVGSLEGRKNHLALLEACERLWQAGRHFRLHLIGLAHPQTGAAALSRLRALQQAGRPIRYDGPVSDACVDLAYASCAFTVYPSICEGFGLPVIESLAHGKPCICSARGALGESAAGGGCVPLAQTDVHALAEAITSLIDDPEFLARLGAQARARRFPSWRDYARKLVGWMHELPRRG